MAAVGVMRQSTDRIDECDAVTADLLRGIVATLEQQLWMIRVQAAWPLTPRLSLTGTDHDEHTAAFRDQGH
jgi:hypothetical protein